MTLATSDPRDPPRVDFHYFEEGTDVSGDDLTAVVDGVRRVRAMTAAMRREVLMREDTPGPELTDEASLKQYVREHAWGHHASCTCPIGPREAGGALASDFRVHGTRGPAGRRRQRLPAHPGYFIVCAIYMIAEKAADVILAAAAAEDGEMSASETSTKKNWRKE